MKDKNTCGFKKTKEYSRIKEDIIRKINYRNKM